MKIGLADDSSSQNQPIISLPFRSMHTTREWENLFCLLFECESHSNFLTEINGHILCVCFLKTVDCSKVICFLTPVLQDDPVFQPPSSLVEMFCVLLCNDPHTGDHDLHSKPACKQPLQSYHKVQDGCVIKLLWSCAKQLTAASSLELYFLVTYCFFPWANSIIQLIWVIFLISVFTFLMQRHVKNIQQEEQQCYNLFFSFLYQLKIDFSLLNITISRFCLIVCAGSFKLFSNVHLSNDVEKQHPTIIIRAKYREYLKQHFKLPAANIRAITWNKFVLF